MKSLQSRRFRPIFKAGREAGVSTGATIVAVNGKAYSKDVLNSAIAAAKDSKAPIELTLKCQGRFRTVPVEYHGEQLPFRLPGRRLLK